MDARISSGFPTHPKTKKLLRRSGPAGPWALVCLFLWARVNRPDGDLSGMTDEDIELAADWSGDDGALVSALAGVGFLDGTEGDRRIHDWAEHQPWSAGAGDRKQASAFAALCKRYGREGAAQRMPEYAERMRSSREPDAVRMPPACEPQSSRMRKACDPDAPLPSPSPSPKELEATIPDGMVVRSLSADPSPSAPPAAAPTPIDPIPHAEIVAAYHEELPMLPKVKHWSARRRALLRSRWREDKERQSIEWWRGFFRYVAGCPFLVGQRSSPGRDPFLADIEWLLAPKNFGCVIEGKYEPRSAA